MELLIKDLEPGQNYIFQARSKTPTGATSAWSTSFKCLTASDTTAPNPITALSWTVNGSSFIGTWTKPTTDSNGKPLKDFNGYQITVTADSVSKIYIVNQERFDFSFDQNVAAFAGAEPTVAISIKVRDRVGNLSTAVTASATNSIPADVTGLTATGIPEAISLAWDATVETDFKTYELYMSTVSAGFSPGPATLISRTTSPSFVLPTVNQVIHYFKLRQLDMFNQPSVTYAAANAIPELSTGIDITPPDDPTSVVVSSTVGANGFSDIAVSWGAVTSTNLAGYVVRYSLDEIAWKYVAVPSDQTGATISNLLVNTPYYVAVAAISYVNAYSDFVNAGTYPITTAQDTTAPSKPSAPTVSIGTLSAQVSHAMTKDAGGNLEADVDHLEVHSSITTGFTTSDATRRGTIDVTIQGITVSAVFPYVPTDSITQVYWRVIAVDRAGNKSTASNQTTGLPGLIEGQNVTDATITNAKINDLSAAKLTAGTAFINNLSIQSELTVNAAGGKLKSNNYDVGAQTGWQLDQSGLVIYDGSIAAKSLLLQDSANIVPAVFADFEFSSDYYHDSGNVGNTTQLTTTSGMLLQVVTSGYKTGKQALRLYNTSITPTTEHTLTFATGGISTSGLNIDVNPGDYIISLWAKKNGTPNQFIRFNMYTDASSSVVSSNISVTSTTMTRYSAVLTVPSGVSKIKLYMDIGPNTSNTGYDVIIDSLQCERKIAGAITPSAWRPPSSTLIDGGSIVTGSIRSSATAVNISSQPAWSLNTQGNLQVGDALVRGRLTVGAPSQSKNIIPGAYTGFESTPSTYYNTSTNVLNTLTMDADGTSWRAAVDTSSPPQGSQALRLYATGLTAASASSVFFSIAKRNTSGNNIFVIPGQRYIVSLWIKRNHSSTVTTLAPSYWGNGSVFRRTSADRIVPTASWVRYSGFITPEVDSFQLAIEVVLGAGETSFDFTIDGLQLELPPTDGSDAPGTFELGSSETSAVQSTNYVAGSRGWAINSDGSVEFNNATLRGNLLVTGSQGQLRTDLSSSGYPTLYLYNNAKDNYSYINLTNISGSGAAELGINSGTYTSTVFPTVVMRPRLWLNNSTRTLSSVNPSQVSLGGYLTMDDSTVLMGYNNASGVKISESRITSTYSSLAKFNSSGTALSAIEVNDDIIELRNKTTAAAARGTLRVGTGGVEMFSSIAGVSPWSKYSFTSGYLERGDLTGWITLILINGWVTRTTGGTFNAPAYKHLPDGTIIFRGSMQGGIATQNTIVTAVGTDATPTRNICVTLCVDTMSGTGNGSPRAYIQNTGNISIYGVGANFVSWDNAYYSLT